MGFAKPLTIILLFTFLGSFVAFAINKGTHGESSYIDELNKRRVEVVENWVEDQRKGRDGGQYWSRDTFVTPKTLFAVRSWEVLDVQDSLADDLVGEIADRFALGRVHDDLVLDLGGLPEAAGK